MSAIRFLLPCVLVLCACGKTKNPSNSGTVYTVTESQWELNFDITKAPEQAQTLSATLAKDLDEITSYTLYGVGEYYGEASGTGLLKVDPNALYIEFYVEGVLTGDKNGVTPNTDPFYIGITAMLRSFFPFSGKYNDFTYDETKKAYVAENFVSTVVDEDDITDTYDLYTKKAEITFINGYLNTVSIVLCTDDTYEVAYAEYVFTFSDINNTVVDIEG
jgi:hypothetical protein